LCERVILGVQAHTVAQNARADYLLAGSSLETFAATLLSG
jgi:hypothetical protein